MPFRSEAQRRKFYSDPQLRKFIPEFEQDTPMWLPEHVPQPLTKRVHQARVKAEKIGQTGKTRQTKRG